MPETIQPSQASFLRDFLLPQLKAEHAVTLRVLSAVPLENEGYRPNPKSRTALELARHIALVEIWFLDAVIDQRFGEIESLVEPMQNCEEVARWYAANGARRIGILEALSGVQLATRVSYFNLRNDPAVAYLNIAIRHSVHHRGQLSAYLRAMGAKVPAIYVESADEPYPPIDGTVAQQPPPAF